MFNWSVFLYSSLAAALISFFLNRAYDQYMSSKIKKKRLKGIREVLIQNISCDMFWLKQIFNYEPELTFTSWNDIKINLSTNLPIEYRVELYQLNPDAFLAVQSYYYELERFKLAFKKSLHTIEPEELVQLIIEKGNSILVTLRAKEFI
ncbi:hypothetical protein SAMN04488502_11581 [Dendrosporobacter quercicolus]|uniref:Uncharacterized protein n=1 Tax=Dendrosporobacter quercicolus TaxID=146817 RepID=A0A1G9ZW24_9FIRM|nr:hypothetical protein SAMN04488502_11581 [Dendrosporobacter quercicolus]